MKITKNYNGARLDRFLSQTLNLPHSLASKLLRKGAIKLNGKKAAISTRLQEGDDILLPASLVITEREVKRGEAFISPLMLEEFKERIIYECEDYFVINKPSGLATQGGSGVRLSVDDFLFVMNPEYRLVHRLDKETSGLLVIAKSRYSASKIAKDFEKKELKKIYIAVTRGIPPYKDGMIDSKIKKQSFPDAGGISELSEDGKESITYYKVIEIKGEFAKIELVLETGRMHQIRVHLSSIGCFIVGDKKYGDFESDLALKIKPKMLLHAYKIYYNGKEIIAPLPEYFLHW